MGLPRDLLSHGTCADFTLAPHSTRGVHTPYAPIQRMVWFRTGSARRYRQIFWEMWYLLQGLDSEGMGLPRDVSSEWCNSCRPPSSPALHTGPFPPSVPYANHALRCESGRSQRTMGSLAGFPWLGECSSISITLLLLSQETAGRVHESLHTPPIHCMGNPSKVWCSTVKPY